MCGEWCWCAASGGGVRRMVLVCNGFQHVVNGFVVRIVFTIVFQKKKKTHARTENSIIPQHFLAS